MPWAVVQMVLVPDTPGVLKSTHCMAKPFTDMVDDVTLSPATPAASEKSRRNPTQCDGVYRSKTLFCSAASTVPNLWQDHVDVDPDGGEHEYSPDEFTMRSALVAEPPPGFEGVSVKAR